MRVVRTACVCQALVLVAAAVWGQSDRAADIVAEVVRTGSVIVRGITFQASGKTLTPASAGPLEQLRQALALHTEWTFEVQGHTTDGGSPDASLRLSRARADAVVDWLTTHGIARTRLVPRGYGDTKPLKGALDDEALRSNRVELRKVNEE